MHDTHQLQHQIATCAAKPGNLNLLSEKRQYIADLRVSNHSLQHRLDFTEFKFKEGQFSRIC